MADTEYEGNRIRKRCRGLDLITHLHNPMRFLTPCQKLCIFFLNVCFLVTLWVMRPSLLSSNYTDEAEGLERLSDLPPVLLLAGGGGLTPAFSLSLWRVMSRTPVGTQAAPRSPGRQQWAWGLRAWRVTFIPWKEWYLALNAYSQWP